MNIVPKDGGMRFIYFSFLFILGILFPPVGSQAKDMGSLISPGDLSSLHGEVEGFSNCTKCHIVGSGITNAACEDCHKEVSAAISSKKGYHSSVSSQKCVECHTDHKGKSHQLVEWEPKQFDHGKAGYELKGKHSKTGCEKCHKTKTKAGLQSYLGLRETCASCHEDVHKGEFKEDCATCHNTEGWKGKNVTFDHNKVYVLDGKHIDVKCEKCHGEKGNFHVAEREKCVTCHLKDDKHKGQLGTACEKCHKTAGWKEILFDHSKAKYQLEGKHTQVSCDKCHPNSKKSGVFKVERFDACDSPFCHDRGKFGDVHERQFAGARCDRCHNLNGFKPSQFRHEAESYLGFKLMGKHAQTPCDKCHAPNATTKTAVYKPINSSTCDAEFCHDTKGRGNAHEGQFKGQRCDQCHTEQGWKPTRFRHEAASYSGYKLLGKHAQTPCEKCHRTAENGEIHYKPINYSSCSTVACHADPHNNQFPDKKCEQCHSPKSWKELGFDHKTQSRWPLEGKHILVNCEKCHVNKIWRPLDSECVNCHRKEDDRAHKGRMGDKCGGCHTAQNWEPTNFGHDVTGFRLDGAHAQAVCADCHKTKAVFTGLGAQCAKCHTDPHYSQFGRLECGDCHTANNWFPEKFRHSAVGFRLEGAHREAACQKCHTNRNYRNLPRDCHGCHIRLNPSIMTSANQQVHSVSGTNCAQCHNVYAWFPPTSYIHQNETFTGYHTTIARDWNSCTKCHPAGNYLTTNWGGVTNESQCSICHAAAAATAHPGGACPSNCALCHNTFTWQGVPSSLALCKPSRKHGR